MKRTIALLLAIALCIPLCACGKSEEAKAVDEMILALGEITLDSKDQIIAVEEAYNALNEKDKESIENLMILTEAKAKLKELLYSSIVDRLTTLNSQCDSVSSFIYMLWDKVGASDFGTYFGCITLFTDENSLDRLKENNNDWRLTVWAAGHALDSKKYDKLWDIDDEAVEDIVGMCIAFTSVYNNLPVLEEEIGDDISYFIKLYKNDYPDEANLLQEWSLESSMYVEFAQSPSGSLFSYRSEMGEYADLMSRFQKKANSII